MSQRLTLKSIKDSRIPALLNICPDDARLGQWIHTFEERAFSRGRFWGSTQLVRFCLTSENCFVTPREVATIDAVSVNGMPMQVQNVWHQFIRPHLPWPGGYGGGGYDLLGVSAGCGAGCGSGSSCGCGCGCGELAVEDRGTSCSVTKTTNDNQKLRVYSQSADNGKTIRFEGIDTNGVPRNDTVTLAAPFADTSTVWGVGNPYAVQKEETTARVLVYSVDQSSSSEFQIAVYEPSELNPSYRVWKVPKALCRTRSITAVVSLQPLPVKYPTDWLLFQNIAAYQDGLMAEKMYEEMNHAMGDAYFFGNQASPRNARGVLRVLRTNGALPTLEAELRRMTGDISAIGMQQAGVTLAGFL